MDTERTPPPYSEGANGENVDETRKVLVFDDSPEFRTFLGHLLKRAGWLTTEYDHPHDFFHETCTNCSGNSCGASALISDVRMPLMRGTEFVRHLQARSCPIRKIALISGGWSASALADAEQLDIEVLDKTEIFGKLLPWLESD